MSQINYVKCAATEILCFLLQVVSLCGTSGHIKNVSLIVLCILKNAVAQLNSLPDAKQKHH